MRRTAHHPLRRLAAPLALALCLSACAGRAPAPVALIQPIDQTLDCDAIQHEIWRNNRRIVELAEEEGLKVAQNVAAGVAGVLFILPLFLMDFQGAAGTDTRALEARNQYLGALATQRCGPPGAAAARG
jgi:hypothetical protein